MASALPLALPGCARASTQTGASLAQAAAKGGRYFGAAVRWAQLNQMPGLRDAIFRECDWLTPEVEMKWAAVEPTRGYLQFEPMDDLVAMARTRGKSVRGHTLLWHKSVPPWAQALLADTRDWQPIRRYFASLIPRYGDSINQWDVVNEPIETGLRMDGLRQSVFLQAFGPDYIIRALREARSFAPRAELMINEFGLDYDMPEDRDRRYLLLKLVERLKKAGAPLDGLGLQAHLDLGKGPFSAPVLAAFLKDVAGLGLSMTVTELDVKEFDYALPADRRDGAVADAARRYLDVVLDQPAVKGVLCWGLSDRQSWLTVSSDDLRRYPGAWPKGQGPGLNRGLPLDAALAPKPMYWAIMECLQDRANG